MLSEVKLYLLDLPTLSTHPVPKMWHCPQVCSEWILWYLRACNSLDLLPCIKFALFQQQWSPLFWEGFFKLQSVEVLPFQYSGMTDKLCRAESLQLSDSSFWSWSCTDDLSCPACSLPLRETLSSSSAARALHQPAGWAAPGDGTPGNSYLFPDPVLPQSYPFSAWTPSS